MPRPLLFCLFLAFPASGCDSEQSTSAAAPPPASTPGQPSVFQPARCGTLTGLVTWVGPIPEVPPVLYGAERADKSGWETRTTVLANAPQIDRFTRGLGGVVVFLREVDPAHARPWDHPPVTVEFRDQQLQVRQGNRTGRTGFVPRGGHITMLSVEPGFHALRARGAAFFSIPFPDPDQPRERQFDTCGRVELASAAGHYWQAADLFVCDHPYYAVTDTAGRFQFAQVPAGKYDLVAWHPNWVVTRTERSPESGLPIRVYYAPPLETSRPVGVPAGRTTLANLTFPK